MKWKRQYGEAELVFSGGPFSELTSARNVLCSDGKRRNTKRVGIADTFYSLPAAVSVKNKTVTGILLLDSNKDILFVADAHGKNYELLPAKES